MFARLTGAVILALALSARLGAQPTDGLHVNWGVHAAYPEYLSGSIGLHTSSEAQPGERRGFFIRLEPGYYGGRLTFGQWRGIDNGLFSTHIGALQTWNSGPGVGASATYVGFEQRVTLGAFEAGLGYYFRASGTTSGLPVASRNSEPANVLTFVLGANFLR